MGCGGEDGESVFEKVFVWVRSGHPSCACCAIPLPLPTTHGIILKGGREGGRDRTAPERHRADKNARDGTAPGVGAQRQRPDTLDGHRDRRLKSGRTDPDFSLDLHGHTLDAAYHRLDSGLVQAKAMGARVVLVVTGKPRPVDAADRGTSRGAIRAKILDWLAAGPHANDIAAIRRAHRKHGGEGALYLVLRRQS